MKDGRADVTEPILRWRAEPPEAGRHDLEGGAYLLRNSARLFWPRAVRLPGCGVNLQDRSAPSVDVQHLPRRREAHFHQTAGLGYDGVSETIEVTDEQMAKLNIESANFHGEWNYTIKPKRTS